jgi:Flp pilus assembly protein TadG
MIDRFRLLLLLGKLRRDEEGSIWILFAILIAVIMGMVGLALDGGRLFALNNEMQDIADAAALAGARELDFSVDSITRATDRAQNLLNNNPHWAEGGSTGVQAGAVQFYTSIGTDPGPTGDVATTDPLVARYIRVTTVDRSVFPTLLRALGASKAAQTRASAMATSGIVACNTQPMMLCNPMEPNEFSATAGQMFHLKPKGGSGSNDFAPGDFGLVDPPGYTSSGADAIKDLLSQQSPAFCYFNLVNPRTGHATGPVIDGLNVRFDRVGSGNTNGMDTSSAPNVTDATQPQATGKGGYQCNQAFEDISGGMKLPRDTLTEAPGTEIGSGPNIAELNAYWQYHYGADWPTDAGAPLTRYRGYLRELGLNLNLTDYTTTTTTPPTRISSEAVAPVCNSVSTANHMRRVLSVSIVNCQAWGVQGNSVNQVGATKYVDFFMTEPSTDGSIYAEFIRVVTPETSGGKLHRVIQLVR